MSHSLQIRIKDEKICEHLTEKQCCGQDLIDSKPGAFSWTHNYFHCEVCRTKYLTIWKGDYREWYELVGNKDNNMPENSPQEKG